MSPLYLSSDRGLVARVCNCALCPVVRTPYPLLVSARPWRYAVVQEGYLLVVSPLPPSLRPMACAETLPKSLLRARQLCFRGRRWGCQRWRPLRAQRPHGRGPRVPPLRVRSRVGRQSHHSVARSRRDRGRHCLFLLLRGMASLARHLSWSSKQ